jgi:hypothetical protein
MDWVANPAWLDRCRERFSVLATVPDDVLLILTHAPRSDKDRTWTRAILEVLEPFGFQDFPFWDAVDVIHSSNGVALTKHRDLELMTMVEILSDTLSHLLRLVDAGRCLVSGLHASSFVWKCSELRIRVQDGRLPVLYYVCTWTVKPKGVFPVLEKMAVLPGKPAFFPDEALFLKTLKKVIAPIKSDAIRKVWSFKSVAQRLAWRASIKAGKARMTAEQKAEFRARLKAAKAAMTPDERTAWCASIKAGKARMTAEQKAEFRARLKAAKAAMTPDERTAWCASMKAGKARMTADQRLQRALKFLSSMAQRTGDEKSATLEKFRQTLASKTEDDWQARRAKHQATLAQWSPERFAERNAKRIGTIQSMSSEDRNNWLADWQAKRHATWAARTAEEVAATKAKHVLSLASFSEEKKATKVDKYLQTMANKGEDAIERRTEKTKATMAKKTKEEHDAMTTKMSQVKKLNNAKRRGLDLAEFLNSETPVERMAEIAVSSYRRSRTKANISDAQTALQNAVMEVVPPLRKKAKTLREDLTASERTKAIRMLCWQGITLPPHCKKSAEAHDDSECDHTASSSHSGAVEPQEAVSA